MTSCIDSEARAQAVRLLRARARQAAAAVETFVRWAHQIETDGSIRALKTTLIDKSRSPILKTVATEVLSELDARAIEECRQRVEQIEREGQERSVAAGLARAFERLYGENPRKAERELIALNKRLEWLKEREWVVANRDSLVRLAPLKDLKPPPTCDREHQEHAAPSARQHGNVVYLPKP